MLMYHHSLLFFKFGMKSTLNLKLSICKLKIIATFISKTNLSKKIDDMILFIENMRLFANLIVL